MTQERFELLRKVYKQKACFYCNRLLTPEITTRDHYIPRNWYKPVKGPKNIRLACHTCNQKKGCLHPQIFIKKAQEAVMNPNCVVHELEYSQEETHYTRTWSCKNCPYSETVFIECL